MPEQRDRVKETTCSRRWAGKPRAWTGRMENVGAGGQGRRAGRKSPSMVTTEKGRDGEEGGGNSLGLPGRDYISPLQKSPKKIF